MSFYLSESSKLHRQGVHPALIEISDLAIKLTVVDFGHPATSGLRSAEVQNALFRRGATPADGYDIISEHQKGRALDFFAYAHGAATWETEPLVMVACAFLQAASVLGHQLEWGGLWATRDYPHVQLVGEE
jgi:peptidoglycan L-alanyl-D-glutamate endopeptidase CwlK